MPYYEIIVQYASGNTATSARVSLGGTWGVSKSVYTDSHGKAVLEHTDSKVTVYVNGRDKGTVRPGKSVVTIR